MDEETQTRVILLLDTLALEVGGLREESHRNFLTLNGGLESLRDEMRAGFERGDPRLGAVEARVNGLER